MSAQRWFGARTLVWLLLWVIISGTVLMVWYDDDARSHAEALGVMGEITRTIHATATLWLVVGSLVHVAIRLVKNPTFKGLWTGAALWAGIGIALITGWWATQTWVQGQLTDTLFVDSRIGVVAHIAYAGVIVTVGLALHITRWGWRRILSPPRPLVGALGLLGIGLALPVAMPGDMVAWRGVTAWLAVPVFGLWIWPLVLAGGLALVAWARR